jgi:signal transduction histidine kinase
MDFRKGDRRRGSSRRLVLGARVFCYLSGGIVLFAAGVTETPAGVGILVWYGLTAAWAGVGLLVDRPVPYWPAFIDVLAPSITGILVGHNPTSLHLLVGAQVAGALLFPRRRGTAFLAYTGAGGIIAGMLLGGLEPIAPLPAGGYAIAETGAVALGLAMALPVITRLAHNSWVTRRRLAEYAEKERRNAEMQRRFVSIVSHEFRTPLAGIVGFAQLLDTTQAVAESDVAEFARAIDVEATHLSRLVEDLLDEFRLDLGRLSVECTSVNAVDVVARLTTPRSDARQIGIDRLPDEALVNADGDRLYQVLRNLVDNACRYGGDHVTVGVVPGAERTRMWVYDDGPGLPSAKVADLFGEYAQVQSGRGLGLGLSIARKLTEAMGGTLHYEDGAPGSRFVIDLPTATPMGTTAWRSESAAGTVGERGGVPTPAGRSFR